MLGTPPPQVHQFYIYSWFQCCPYVLAQSLRMSVVRDSDCQNRRNDRPDHDWNWLSAKINNLWKRLHPSSNIGVEMFLPKNQKSFLLPWKHALVQPILKKGDRSDPSNYRPVPTLSPTSLNFSSSPNSFSFLNLTGVFLIISMTFARWTPVVISFPALLKSGRPLRDFGKSYDLAFDILKAFYRLWHRVLISKVPLLRLYGWGLTLLKTQFLSISPKTPHEFILSFKNSVVQQFNVINMLVITKTTYLSQKHNIIQIAKSAQKTPSKILFYRAAPLIVRRTGSSFVTVEYPAICVL